MDEIMKEEMRESHDVQRDILKGACVAMSCNSDNVLHLAVAGDDESYCKLLWLSRAPTLQQ